MKNKKITNDFISLHNHTDHSVGDSIIRVSDLIENAIDTVSISDHGTISGYIDFKNNCLTNDIKGIYGCEFYCVEDYVDSRYNNREHLLVLAKDNIGLKQIQKLNYISNQHHNYKPVLEYNEFKNIEEGHLIVSSACGYGHIPQAIINGEDVEQAYNDLYSLFGDNLYLELQPHSKDEYKEQSIINQGLIDLDEQIIVTTDAHYIHKDDVIGRSMRHSIEFKKSYQEQITGSFKGVSSNSFCRNKEQISTLVDRYNKSTNIGIIDDDLLDYCCKNTVEIAKSCNVEFPKYEKHIPVFNKHDELRRSLGLV